jgi:hypothetical protein
MATDTYLRNNIEKLKQSKSKMTLLERLEYDRLNSLTFRSNYRNYLNTDFRLVLSTGIIGLNIVKGMDINSNQAIIVYESASGDGGVTINNGRLQETLPVRGMILSKDNDELLNKCRDLTVAKESGEAIDFITPFSRIRGDKGNKFFIESLEFNTGDSSPTSMPFTMTLSENRMANIKTTAVNLVNYQSAEMMKQYYNLLVGNV